MNRRAFLKGLALIASGATLARLRWPQAEPRVAVATFGDWLAQKPEEDVDLVCGQSRLLEVRLLDAHGNIVARQTCRHWGVDPDAGHARNLVEILFPPQVGQQFTVAGFEIAEVGDAHAVFRGELPRSVNIGFGVTPVFAIGDLVAGVGEGGS